MFVIGIVLLDLVAVIYIRIAVVTVTVADNTAVKIFCLFHKQLALNSHGAHRDASSSMLLCIST